MQREKREIAHGLARSTFVYQFLELREIVKRVRLRALFLFSRLNACRKCLQNLMRDGPDGYCLKKNVTVTMQNFGWVSSLCLLLFLASESIFDINEQTFLV